MKISKSLAESIAKQALSSRIEEVNNAKAGLSTLATSIVWAKVPKEIRACFAKHKEYLTMKRSAQVFVPGRAQDYTMFQFTEKVPYNSDRSSIQISEKQHDELLAFKKKVDHLEDTLKKDQTALETALVQLGTKARVLKELPELEKYFPAEITMALVPNLANIKTILKSA